MRATPGIDYVPGDVKSEEQHIVQHVGGGEPRSIKQTGRSWRGFPLRTGKVHASAKSASCITMCNIKTSTWRFFICARAYSKKIKNENSCLFLTSKVENMKTLNLRIWRIAVDTSSALKKGLKFISRYIILEKSIPSPHHHDNDDQDLPSQVNSAVSPRHQERQILMDTVKTVFWLCLRA